MEKPLLAVAFVLVSALACASSPPPAPTVAIGAAQAAQASPAAVGTRLAVVDVQRAVLESQDGVRAQASLKQDYEQRQRDLDAKQGEVTRERDDLERQAGALAKDVLERRRAELMRKLTELQSLHVEYQKGLQQRQNELTAPILKRMTAVISREAERDGYDLVLDKAAAPYMRPSLDLTDRIIRAYDSGA
jgi:outer membrane protein